jgi:hypothetical protein
MFARLLTNPAAAAQPTISEVMSVMLLSLPLLSLLPFLLSLPLLSLSLFNVGMGRPAVTRTDAKKKITPIFQGIFDSTEKQQDKLGMNSFPLSPLSSKSTKMKSANSFPSAHLTWLFLFADLERSGWWVFEKMSNIKKVQKN